MILSPVRDEGFVSHPWITPATPACATADGKVSALSLCVGVFSFLKSIFDVETTTYNTFSLITDHMTFPVVDLIHENLSKTFQESLSDMCV